MTWIQSLKIAALCCVALVLAVACGGDSFSYDSASYFVESYRTTYTLEAECAQSPTHGNDYVVTYVSPEAKAAFDDRAVTAPACAVAVKEQYDNAECSGEPTSYKAMRKKDGEGWDWQDVAEDGSISASGDLGGCSGCHSACTGAGFCTPN